MAEDRKSKVDLEAEVWNAIAAFEQILEAIPNDRASLEALAHAYEQIGDHVRAKEHLVRFAEVLVSESDVDAASGLLDKLNSYAGEDPRSKQLAVKIVNMKAGAGRISGGDTPASGGDASASAKADHKFSSFNMGDELSFAWNLMEAGQISQEEYAGVVQDLSEMSAGESKATVSVLHALTAREFKGIDNLIGYVAKTSGAPVISLGGFDLQYKTFSQLPLEVMVERGVIPFEELGNEIMIVILNPFDKSLMKEIEKALGKKCHYYIATPVDFDAAIEKITETLSEVAKAEAEAQNEA